MTDPTATNDPAPSGPEAVSDETADARRHRGDQGRPDAIVAVIWVTAGLVGLAALGLLVMLVARDESRDTAYRRAHEDQRSIGPTNGRLDDGSMVGAATFYDEDGRICTIFGPPGERGDDLYCVTDTPEEVDAVNWEIDPDEGVDLTVVIVDGESPHIAFTFDGRTPSHAMGWFPVVKPAVVSVYVGPPWDDLEIDTGSLG